MYLAETIEFSPNVDKFSLVAGTMFTFEAISLEHILPCEAGDVRGVSSTGAGDELLCSQQSA
jgi:hypothetical protein